MEDNMKIEQTTKLENGEVLTTELSEDVMTDETGINGLALAALAALGGAAAIAFAKRGKIKSKITERQVKRLEKKGFNVSKVEVVEGEDDVDPEKDTEE